jgi:hypothetical protein
MARTYIELPSSGVVDMFDDIPLSFNYAIADIRDPDKRDTTYSKTITIPGTKNNNKLFDHFFNVGKSGGFNPKVKAKAIVYVDTVPVFDGYLQLTDVKVEDKNAVEYEVVIFGKLANIYTVWADDELRDIEYSDLDHSYTSVTIQSTWLATKGTGYVYPLIDYGWTDGSYYNVEHFRPALYVKEYVDRMFTYAGFTYTSTFFNTDFFKTLIIPFNGLLSLPSSEVTARTFKVNNSASVDMSTPTTGVLSSVYPFTANTFVTTPNPSGQFDTGTYKWTVASAGTYTVYFNMDIEMDVNNPTGGDISATVLSVFRIRLVLKPLATGVASMVNAKNTTVGAGSGTNFVASTTTTTQGTTIFKSIPLHLKVGDILYLESDSGLISAVNTSLVITSRIKAGSLFYNLPVADSVNDGDTLYFNSAIPDKVKIRDFFTSIIKMFNLYVEEDKDTANNLFIEPRNDFYANGTTYDWTQKLDLSQPVDIKPMGMLEARDYNFTYKEDKDKWNVRYFNTFSRIYGDRTISSNSDFLTDTKDIEIIFSPTPSVTIPYGTTSDRIIPQIVSEDSTGIIKAHSGSLRILQFSGLLACPNGSWKLFSSNGSYSSHYSYPYSGHLNHPTSGEIDINFGVVSEVFYLVDSYTNNNLYNKYWKKYIDEITDQESKLVTGYFHLTPLDMLQLDFRNKIYVDGHYYFINKIEDYNPTADELTKVELILIKDGVDFVATSGTGSAAIEFPFDESGGGFFNPEFQDGNLYNPQANQTVTGKDNIVDATAINVIISGDNNVVGSDTSGVVLFNSVNNVVYPGLTNVVLINSSGVTVTESNVTYVGGVAINSDWSLAGNAGTTAGTNFIGTTDAQDLVIKTNNTERARILTTGELGLNESSPTATLHIKATGVPDNTTYTFKAKNSTLCGLYVRGDGVIVLGAGSNADSGMAVIDGSTMMFGNKSIQTLGTFTINNSGNDVWMVGSKFKFTDAGAYVQEGTINVSNWKIITGTNNMVDIGNTSQLPVLNLSDGTTGTVKISLNV